MDPSAAEQQQMSVKKTASTTNLDNHVDSDLCYIGRDAAIDVPQPSKLQKHLLLLAIRLILRFRSTVGRVLMLNKYLCVKFGSLLDIAEAQSMVFIARHTSIPVPKVYFAFTHKRRTYILMERIHGQIVGRNWVYRSPASQLAILESLKEMILEMRRLKTDSNLICSVNGGSLFDPRMPTVTGRFGPFKNVQEFHCWLRNGIQAHINHKPDVTKLINMHGQHWDGPTFTHGDLSSLNIIVRGDKVVGIVDWETAGWFPSYWEYTTACQVNPQNMFWRDEIEKFLIPMPDALVMEELRQKYFGDF